MGRNRPRRICVVRDGEGGSVDRPSGEVLGRHHRGNDRHPHPQRLPAQPRAGRYRLRRGRSRGQALRHPIRRNRAGERRRRGATPNCGTPRQTVSSMATRARMINRPAPPSELVPLETIFTSCVHGRPAGPVALMRGSRHGVGAQPPLLPRAHGPAPQARTLRRVVPERALPQLPDTRQRASRVMCAAKLLMASS